MSRRREGLDRRGREQLANAREKTHRCAAARTETFAANRGFAIGCKLRGGNNSPESVGEAIRGSIQGRLRLYVDGGRVFRVRTGAL
jgi:hypothetical protein